MLGRLCILSELILVSLHSSDNYPCDSDICVDSTQTWAGYNCRQAALEKGWCKFNFVNSSCCAACKEAVELNINVDHPVPPIGLFLSLNVFYILGFEL